MGSEKKKLFFLDAYALIFRAYYAFINRQMYNKDGLNTTAVFGFLLALDEILRNEKPTHIAVVFDPPTPTFRHEKLETYKANREETPEEIKKSVPVIKEMLHAFRIPVIEVEGYEADDVIGTLSKKAEKLGYSVYMMTPDKDFTQLVSESIFMYKPRKGGGQAEIIGVEEVKKLFCVDSPRQVIDVLALWGDSSDNIPGAPGIGEKTAKKLINQYGSIESLMQHIDQLKEKQRESIVNNIQQINLSRELVTIRLDVPVLFDEDELSVKSPDIKELSRLFDELDFKALSERIIGTGRETEQQGMLQEKKGIQQAQQGSLFNEDGDKEKAPGFNHIGNTQHVYYLVENDEGIKQLIGKIAGVKDFCFDTETSDVDPLKAELVGISFSFREHEAYYLPLPGEKDKVIPILNGFRGLFADETITKTGQNIKYDIQVLDKYKIAVKGPLFDTMIAHYLLHPESRHNLNYLSEKYLNYHPITIEELIGKKGPSQGDMRMVSKELVKEYACEDADLTWQLSSILSTELKRNDLYNLAVSAEFPLIHVLSAMEIAGFVLNSEELKQYGHILRRDLVKTEEEIFQLAGEQFNISSPRQLGVILFEKLKITDKVKKTRSKQYSTGEEVLSRLTDKHPVVGKVLEYRAIKKLLSTYVEALPQMINPKTGRIHTSFNQAITVTGRLSSNNPNLQNIPVREERGREIRKAFVPGGEGNVLISADYSQIELRLMAHMSNDEHLIEAFERQEDIHTATAAKIFNVPVQNVTRDMRSKAKTANFGIIYGISAFGLSQRLDISKSDAKTLIEGYFRSYPRVREYMDQSIKEAREHGYVRTILGRKRFLPDIHSRNAVVRGFAERNAINAPLQGSAADIIKLAMININRKTDELGLKGKMILQVHDELIFDVPDNEKEVFTELVRKEMECACTLKVPLIVDIGTGNNWLEAH